MVYLLATCAALANALTSVLQRMGVEDAPASARLRMRLIAHAVRRRVWLAGFGLMVVSFVMQATALHLGQLSTVQPILTAELVFLVVILAARFRYNVGWRDWLGVLAAAAGLSGFLVFANPRGGGRVPGVDEWVPVIVGCTAAIAATVALAQRGPRWFRAAMFGTAAAVAYAAAAACTKEMTGFLASDWTSIFWHWQTYGLAGFGVTAVFLAQNAYHAGPIAASQSTLVLADPLASILIGVVLFGDDLRTGGAWGPLEALSLLVLFGGGVLLSNSPLVAGMRAGGTAEEERLATRYRPLRSQGPFPDAHANPTA